MSINDLLRQQQEINERIKAASAPKPAQKRKPRAVKPQQADG